MNVKILFFNILILISFQNTLYAPPPLTPEQQRIQEMYERLIQRIEKKREESRLREIAGIQQLHGKVLEEIRNRIKYEIKKIGSLAEVQQKIQNRLRQSIPEKKQSRLICDLKETEFIQQQSLINLKDYQEELQQKEQQFQIAEQTLEQKDLEELEQLQQEAYNNFENFMESSIKKYEVDYIKDNNPITSSEKKLKNVRVYYAEPGILETVQNLFIIIRYWGSSYLEMGSSYFKTSNYENQKIKPEFKNPEELEKQDIEQKKHTTNYVEDCISFIRNIADKSHYKQEIKPEFQKYFLKKQQPFLGKIVSPEE